MEPLQYGRRSTLSKHFSNFSADFFILGNILNFSIITLLHKYNTNWLYQIKITYISSEMQIKALWSKTDVNRFCLLKEVIQ